MKKIYAWMICFLIAAGITVPAMAAQTPCVVDEAQLFSDHEEQVLTQAAQELIEEYGMDVVLLTVDSTGGKDITAFADDYYDYNGYGIGSYDSGVLLVVAMGTREWAISTCGDSIDALTDYGQELLMESVTPQLSSGNYYAAFSTYLRELDTYFAAYAAGDAIDKETDLFMLIIISLAIGLVVAGITIAVLNSGMKTAVAQRNASGYVKEGSYKLLRQQDIFLYSRTTKVKRAESSSGSSTHRSSSGRSHGGSRGRF